MEELAAYSSASLLGALSRDVALLTAVLDSQHHGSYLSQGYDVTHVALLGATVAAAEASGTATTTTAGRALSGDVADTTAGLVMSASSSLALQRQETTKKLT